MKIIAAIVVGLLVCYFAVSLGMLPLIAGLIGPVKECGNAASDLSPQSLEKDGDRKLVAGCAKVIATGAMVEKVTSKKP